MVVPTFRVPDAADRCLLTLTSEGARRRLPLFETERDVILSRKANSFCSQCETLN